VSERAIFRGDALPETTDVECDVCIVGSGPGGATLAAKLTAKGRSVVMLEEGGHYTRKNFDMRESTAFAHLYQDLGNRSTDDLSIHILQGRSVGGGTTVNWTTSLRTPSRILQHWRERFGLEQMKPEVLEPHWAWAEERLSIKRWPEGAANRNNGLLWDGLGKLGYERAMNPRNVKNCANLGYCGMGCPIDAKQSTLVTLIPEAVERGLSLYTNCWVYRLEWSGRRVVAAHARVLDERNNNTSKTVTVRAKTFALCGGAINSPVLLLRSGLTANDNVGRRTFLHPVVSTMGFFSEPVDGHAGAPQSVHSHHFSVREKGKIGFFLETAPIHPMLAGSNVTWFGAAQQEMMTKFRYAQATIGLTIDGLLAEEEGATVRLRNRESRRLSIRYKFVPANWEAFREACREMARVQFAAGAQAVWSLHENPVEMKSERDLHLLDAAEWKPQRIRIFTAHQMGGCAMGSDAKTSVVDPALRYRGLDNLLVVDGSVFPTSVGVNPQLSVFGVASWAAENLI
jgi:choline dehydrogenase-like flavoprotein